VGDQHGQQQQGCEGEQQHFYLPNVAWASA
jgi:hypothetical protein